MSTPAHTHALSWPLPRKPSPSVSAEGSRTARAAVAVCSTLTHLRRALQFAPPSQPRALRGRAVAATSLAEDRQGLIPCWQRQWRWQHTTTCSACGGRRAADRCAASGGGLCAAARRWLCFFLLRRPVSREQRSCVGMAPVALLLLGGASSALALVFAVGRWVEAGGAQAAGCCVRVCVRGKLPPALFPTKRTHPAGDDPAARAGSGVFSLGTRAVCSTVRVLVPATPLVLIVVADCGLNVLMATCTPRVWRTTATCYGRAGTG